MYDEVVLSRVKTEETEDEDLRDGVYEPFSVIVNAEGGPKDKRNVMAAQEYCNECVALGGKWVQWNKMSKRVEFLYVKRRLRQAKRDRWQLVKHESKRLKLGDANTTKAEKVRN